MEATLAAVLGVLSVITALFPTWLESLIGLSPDEGNGSAEWWLVALFAVAATAAAFAARHDFRTHRASATH